MQDAWGIELHATLHDDNDIDYYALEVLDSDTVLIADVFEGRGQYTVHMTYICPDGQLGIQDCSGSKDSLEGIEFCVDNDGLVGLTRFCKESPVSAGGTVLVGVRAKEFASDCDDYGLKIFATYGTSETN